MSELNRRYELELKMGADNLQALRGMLHTLLFDMDRIDENALEQVNPYNQVSGGYDGNHTLKITFRSDVTHDSYFEQVNAYLDKGEQES